MAWLGTPGFVIEGIGGWAIDILKVVNLWSRDGIEDSEFSEAVGVDVSKIGHCYSNHSVQMFVFYMPVGPINAVLRRAMIGHLVGALEPQRLAGGGASHTQLFDDRFIQPPTQELKINYSFPTCAIHVRLGMTGFSKVPTIYIQQQQHSTPAATRQGGPKFRREHLLHMSVFIAPIGEERGELLGV